MNKTECIVCGVLLGLDEVVYSYDKDEPLCQDCADRAEAYAESVAHDRDIDALREERGNE